MGLYSHLLNSKKGSRSKVLQNIFYMHYSQDQFFYVTNT